MLPEKSFTLFLKYYWQCKAYSTSLGGTFNFGFAWTLPDQKPSPPEP